MNLIRYVKRRGRLECESISERVGDSLTELRFPESLVGSVKLFDTEKKIDGMACIFDTGRLKDGFYYPALHLGGAPIELEGFEVRLGRLHLIPKDDAYVRRLSGELEAVRCELSEIKRTLAAHNEKINGNPIF